MAGELGEIEAVGTIEWFAFGPTVVGEDVVEGDDEFGEGGGEVEFFLRSRGDELLHEAEVAVEVTSGDDGEAGTGEGIVGIIPLGLLGVEPDAAAGDEVADFDSGGEEEFLGESDADEVFIFITEEEAVGSVGFFAFLEEVVAVLIEDDGVTWVGEGILPGFEAVGDVGKNELGLIESLGESLRLNFCLQL